MALGGLVLGSLILYLKGMRIMMFQLSGFYCNSYDISCIFYYIGTREPSAQYSVEEYSCTWA